jgi:beta-N-acetylhexosaminidase
MVGQQVMGTMDGTSPDGALLARIRAGEVGGIMIGSPNVVSPEQLTSAINAIQTAAREGGNPPLLISVDQEGGEVKRLSWAAPSRSAEQMGSEGPGVAESEGRATGQALRASGINVDLAPVADVAHSHGMFIWQQQRSFGTDPGAVTADASSFVTGLQSAEVAATAKHFPGLGGTAQDTDYSRQTVNLSAVDLAPYHTLIPGGVALIMVSVATYANLDPTHPAAFSEPIVTGLLRDRLGFGGVIITDDLQAPNGQATGAAAVSADRAGIDIALLSTTEAGGAEAYQALLSAAQSGAISQAHIADSYRRILNLKAQYADS